MIYPEYMTREDIEAFELDMARFELDPSMEFDEVNRELRIVAEIQQQELAENLDILPV